MTIRNVVAKIPALFSSRRRMDRLKVYQGSYTGIVILVLIVIAASIVLLGDRSSIFSIKGNTQTLTIRTTTNPINEWVFSQGTVFAVNSETNEYSLTEDAPLIIEAGIKLIITAFQQGDNTTVVINAKKDNGIVATIEDPDTDIVLTDYIDITIKITSTLSFPFEGEALIGEDIGDGVDSILLSGEIRVLEQLFLTSGRYQGEIYDLNTGDRVFVTNNNQSVVSKGFVRVTRDESFYFSAISEGSEARVIRFGSQDIVITPSFWSRITKDPIVSAMTAFLALMFLLLEFVLLVRQTIKEKD